MNKQMKEDKRFKQCNKELFATIIFFIFNIILVFILTFPFGYNVEAENIKIIAGFPKWYLFGVIFSVIILCIATYFLVKFFFKDMSLNGYVNKEGEDEV